MPYGLTNAPAVFQSMINEIFRNILNQLIIVYIRDILVWSKSREDHIIHVRAMLTCLKQDNLYAKLEKCEFHCQTIIFLGYVLSHNRVEMDQAKVKAVKDWPEPATIKELQQFLGFAQNFYRWFIRNYSTITDALISLLKGKPKRLSWSEPVHEAFNKLTTAPILCHPDPESTGRSGHL